MGGIRTKPITVPTTTPISANQIILFLNNKDVANLRSVRCCDGFGYLPRRFMRLSWLHEARNLGRTPDYGRLGSLVLFPDSVRFNILVALQVYDDRARDLAAKCRILVVRQT